METLTRSIAPWRDWGAHSRSWAYHIGHRHEQQICIIAHRELLIDRPSHNLWIDMDSRSRQAEGRRGGCSWFLKPYYPKKSHIRPSKVFGVSPPLAISLHIVFQQFLYLPSWTTNNRDRHDPPLGQDNLLSAIANLIITIFHISTKHTTKCSLTTKWIAVASPCKIKDKIVRPWKMFEIICLLWLVFGSPSSDPSYQIF